MSGFAAESPQVEWLTEQQLAAVDPHQLVSEGELLATGLLPLSWSIRFRERAAQEAARFAARTRTLIVRSRWLAHELQSPVHPRHRSEVAHHLPMSFEHVVAALGGPIQERIGGVQLRCREGELTTRPRRFEAEGFLRLPASYPELPVRLSVEPWWRDRCVVGLSLRSSRRFRYPRRYFMSAHRVLSELTHEAGLSPHH